MKELLELIKGRVYTVKVPQWTIGYRKEGDEIVTINVSENEREVYLNRPVQVMITIERMVFLNSIDAYVLIDPSKVQEIKNILTDFISVSNGYLRFNDDEEVVRLIDLTELLLSDMTVPETNIKDNKKEKVKMIGKIPIPERRRRDGNR